MIRKTPILLSIISFVLAACSQTQEPAITQRMTNSNIGPVSESTISTVTSTPDPILLETAASLYLAPGLTARYASKTTTQGDDVIIAMIKGGDVFVIDGLYFDRTGSVESTENAPVDAPAYVLVNEETNESHLVGWFDENTNFVIEASTGYPLNVRAGPGIGIEIGPEGEEFYVYGFAWYPRWRRIFQEPVIALLNDFYTEGIEHVREGMKNYRKVASPYYSGGDLGLVTWDETLLTSMDGWGANLPGPPFIHLPDSGTVDMRITQFQEAIDNGLIMMDEECVDRYVSSDYPKNSNYATIQSKDAVIDKMLGPFRTPNRYSDLQKLIILGVVYDERGPLTLLVDIGCEYAYFVPDTGEKVIKIAPSEVDLMFGYDGIYFSKIPHELAHSLEYRDHDFFAERCWQGEEFSVEVLKYLLEYMWWVQQYPGDAPNWDWEPINSGLVLARMLDGTFHSFSCE